MGEEVVYGREEVRMVVRSFVICGYGIWISYWIVLILVCLFVNVVN